MIYTFITAVSIAAMAFISYLLSKHEKDDVHDGPLDNQKYDAWDHDDMSHTEGEI